MYKYQIGVVIKVLDRNNDKQGSESTERLKNGQSNQAFNSHFIIINFPKKIQ